MILEILSVGLIIPFLNSLVRGGINFEILEFLNFLNNLDIMRIVLILVFIYSIKSIFLTFFSYLQSRYLANIRASLSNTLFKLYINRPYEFHLKNNTSKLIRNIGETNLIVYTIKSTIILINEALVMLGISLFIIIFQPKISFFVIVILSLIGYLFYKIIQGKMKLWGKIRQESSEIFLKFKMKVLDSLKKSKF